MCSEEWNARRSIPSTVIVVGFGMSDSQLFGAGPSLAARPEGDRARQATASLRGYIYQIYASAIALIELADDEVLHLEVAEDYSITTESALKAVQVKDSAGRQRLLELTQGTEAATDLIDGAGRHGFTRSHPQTDLCRNLRDDKVARPVTSNRPKALVDADQFVRWFRHQQTRSNPSSRRRLGETTNHNRASAQQLV